MKKLLVIITMLVTLLVPAVAFAGPAESAKSQVCQGLTNTITGSSCDASGAQTTLKGIMKTVLNILSWVAGIAAIIMIVIAGLKYITSGGDSSSIASAKSTLIYAIVGVIVVVSAQLIVHLALHAGKLG
jgi:hypothetical protein